MAIGSGLSDERTRRTLDGASGWSSAHISGIGGALEDAAQIIEDVLTGIERPLRGYSRITNRREVILAEWENGHPYEDYRVSLLYLIGDLASL